MLSVNMVIRHHSVRAHEIMREHDDKGSTLDLQVRILFHKQLQTELREMEKRSKQGDLLTYFSKRLKIDGNRETNTDASVSEHSKCSHSEQEMCTSDPHCTTISEARRQQEETSCLTSDPQVEVNDIGNMVGDPLKKFSLEQLFAVHSHNASVRCIAAAGMYAASGGADEVVQLYDMTRKKCSGALTQHEGTVTCLEFTPTGSHLLSGSEDGSIAVCRTGSWQLEKFWAQAHKGSAAISLSCHPTGKLALSLGTDGILKTWNMVKGRLAYAKNLGSANRRLVTCVAWSVKGNWYVVVVGVKAHVYSVTTAEITYTVDYGKKITSVCFVKNNVLCVGDEFGAIHLFNVVKKKKLNEVVAHNNRVKCMSSGSVNGHIYVVSAASSGQMKLWRYKKCLLFAICSVETGCRITCLATSRLCMDSKNNVKRKRAREMVLAKPAEGNNLKRQGAKEMVSPSPAEGNNVKRKRRVRDTVSPRPAEGNNMKRQGAKEMVSPSPAEGNNVKRKRQRVRDTVSPRPAEGNNMKRRAREMVSPSPAEGNSEHLVVDITSGKESAGLGAQRTKAKRKGQEIVLETRRKCKKLKRETRNVNGEIITCTPGQAWDVGDV